MIEPTNHVRFTPGNRGRIRLHLNDGEGGESTALSLTSSAEISVMEFGSAAQQGSALYGNTPIPEKDFLLLRANANGSGRPVAVAVVENSGAATDSSYAPFWLELFGISSIDPLQPVLSSALLSMNKDCRLQP